MKHSEEEEKEDKEKEDRRHYLVLCKSETKALKLTFDEQKHTCAKWRHTSFKT